MLGGQADCQMYLLGTVVVSGIAHFPGNRKERQDEVALVLGLVPAVAQPLAGEGPELPLVLQYLVCHGRTDRMLCQTGHKAVVGSLDVVVTVVNRK